MDAILLVAHGSEHGNEGLERLASRVGRIAGVPTAVSFKRFGSPKPLAALSSLADEGAEDVTVVPLFLSEGRYAASVPRNLEIREDDTADVSGRTVGVRITGILGSCPGLAECATDEVLRIAGTADGTGIVIISHGGGGGPIRKGLQAAGFAVSTACDAESAMQAAEHLRSAGSGIVVALPLRMSSGAPVRDLPSTPPVGDWNGLPELIAEISARPRRRHTSPVNFFRPFKYFLDNPKL